MKCDKNKLHRFIDGELHRTEEEEIKNHIEECPNCRAFVNDIRSALTLLRSGGRQSPPREIFDAVQESLGRAPVLRLPLKAALGAAAAAAVIFAVLTITSPNGADAEVEYYIENQMDALFGQALREEVLYENDWERELDEMLFERGL